MNVVIIGLGYVGSTILKEVNRTKSMLSRIRVMGYDIDKSKCIFENSTSNIDEIKKADMYIVCVPTPTVNKKVELKYIKKALADIKPFTKDKHVVLESTIPPNSFHILTKILDTNLLGYSPERFAPGETTTRDHPKVLAANNPKTLKLMKKFYSKISDPYIIDDFEKGIEKAVLCKILENTQRMVNIQLMNEFYMMYPDIFPDALKASKTKGGFNYYKPGLVSGQCIPMDCYFTDSKYINNFCSLEDKMFNYIYNKIIELDRVKNGAIVIFGVGYKPNSGDINYSRNYELVKELRKFKNNVFIYDPLAGIIEYESIKPNDILVKLVDHNIFKSLDLKYDIEL